MEEPFTMLKAIAQIPRVILKPGQFFDGDVVRTRCKHCGAVKQNGKCPVSDCARQRRR